MKNVHNRNNPLSPYEFQDIVKKKYPEVYEEVMSNHRGSDISIDRIRAMWYISHVFGDEASWVFVGACLKIYSPSTLLVGSRVRHGLAAIIADVKGVKRAAISKLVPRVAAQYRGVENFRANVDRLSLIDNVKLQKTS